jgi:glutamate N-acetyltransferase/amino-acid N-acetyltransferase
MSVTAAKGFVAAGVAAGIKTDGLDIAVLVADRSCTTAAVFTKNQAAAAPVVLGRASLGGDSMKRAIVVNSGCANAATGSLGLANGVLMTETLAAELGCDVDDVLVCSTGTIGPQLPMERVVPGIAAAVAQLDSSLESAGRAATAILTTDSIAKQAVATGDGWTIGGMSKGAGMVRPNMATMLAFITTDAVVVPKLLNESLQTAADATFNSLNIDGCESTNDTVIAMASGVSQVVPDPVEFASAMEDVCRNLALQMAGDAEGASRVIAIEVTGAASNEDARSLGRTVSDSALVRSSFYGGDVNWGRILGALGASPIKIDPERITIAYQGVAVFTNGMGTSYDEMSLLASIETGDFGITIDLGNGQGRADIVTTDLTPDYVVFNGERS